MLFRYFICQTAYLLLALYFTCVKVLCHFYYILPNWLTSTIQNLSHYLCAHALWKMDSVFELYLGPDSGLVGTMAGAVAGEPDDIPKVNQPVWVLGKCYNALHEIELIRRDVQSRLWCTYRRGFVPLGEAQLTTDKGWGCMLRCGQMVLAQALIDLHLGRDWYWTPECRDPVYLNIINRFEDSRKSYFSIHQIALMGDSEDKKVGEWFGPNTVAQVLKKLVPYDDWCRLVVHVAMDNTIVIDEIVSLCQADSLRRNSWKPLLLVIPLRLGLNDINPIYIPALKKCFELLGNCGVIGGRPNQALYFIGYIEDEVLYLDPHTTQRSGSVGQKTSQHECEFDETFHQKYAGRLQFKQMAPSLALCFLCKDRLDFDILLDKMITEVLPASTQPMFEVHLRRSPEWKSYHESSKDLYGMHNSKSKDNLTTTFASDHLSDNHRKTVACDSKDVVVPRQGDTEEFENVNDNELYDNELKRHFRKDDNCSHASDTDEDFEFIT